MSASEKIRTLHYFLFFQILLTFLLTGCAQFRLPAIDPSGNQVFSPNQSTVLISPFPVEPAFLEPAPYCELPDPFLIESSPVLGTPTYLPGHYPVSQPILEIPPGRLSPPLLQTPQPISTYQPAVVTNPTPFQNAKVVLTPPKVVAPVGSEVILLSGIQGAGGRYANNKKIEWVLSQESVGNFIHIDQRGYSLLGNWLGKEKNGRRGAGFAISETVGSGQLLTRNTPSRHDDIWVPPSHTWISLSSPTEGASYVTASTPKLNTNYHSQQTTTIHWVDAKWQFPSSAKTTSGKPYPLTTVLSRNSNNLPLSGWAVRYQILGGSAAAWNPQGSQAIDITSDSDGKATAQLLPTTNQGGVTDIQIDLFRVAGSQAQGASLATQRLQVQWSAPNLQVEMRGPETATVGGLATYEIILQNHGTLPATNIEVIDNLPPALQLVESYPEAETFGTQQKWKITNLPAQSQQKIVLSCRPTEPGDIQHCVNIQSAQGQQSQSCKRTRITAPKIELKMNGPTTAEVGQTVQYQVEITNLGQQTETNLLLTDTFDSGLEHSSANSPIERQLGPLAPGATERIGITFKVTKEGTLCHRLQVTNNSGYQTQKDSCLTATMPAVVPQPNYTMKIDGPSNGVVGEVVTFTVTVDNIGNVPLTEVVLTNTFGPHLLPVNATPNFVAEPTFLQWSVPQINPQIRAVWTIQCRCQSVATPAENIVTLGSKELSQKSATSQINISEKPPTGDAGQGTLPETNPVLTLSLAALTDPVVVGQVARYRVTINNIGTQEDEAVRIQFHFPDSVLEPKIIGASTLNPPQAGATCELAPILRLGPQDPYSFLIELTPKQVGQLELTANAISSRQQQAIGAKDVITILAK
ncbi:MAG: DUF11 domain-containing protein [Pirellulaceae bacterium]|nr:DUF11 domain-containing protein [Pirellulaceae bacterium]